MSNKLVMVFSSRIKKDPHYIYGLENDAINTIIENQTIILREVSKTFRKKMGAKLGRYHFRKFYIGKDPNILLLDMDDTPMTRLFVKELAEYMYENALAISY